MITGFRSRRWLDYNGKICRNFYMNMCIKERLSKRELERQIDSGYYERYIELAGTVSEEE